MAAAVFFLVILHLKLWQNKKKLNDPEKLKDALTGEQWWKMNRLETERETYVFTHIASIITIIILYNCPVLHYVTIKLTKDG